MTGFIVREIGRPSMNRPELANIPQSPDRSAFHQMGGETDNVKYLSADGHHESVRRNGEEVTGENAATYNYGTNPVSHTVLDIVPWVAVGTQSPGDKSTVLSRLKAVVTTVVKPCVQDSGADMGGRAVCQ
ncbi:MAG: hypothetical protein KF689_10445 [Gemmatimonadaceae bacterium]|nr:hypothetical protein [Gemmatimonadaceae bacterium]MCW5825983.1 hypothetical protein [Gemmatimonadaceae bacterium]